MTQPDSRAEPTRSPGALTGVAWLLGFRILDRAAGVVSFLVLARLLLPEHFGVVALATAVIAFIEILTSLGLDTILIQVRDPTPDHYDTAWTIQIASSSICALLIAALAWPASEFFREPRLFAVLCLLALSFAIEGMQSIKLVDFRRAMRFDKEFQFLATRRLITIVVTISAALALRNEMALAVGMLVSRIVGTGLSYVMRPYKPRLTLALKGEFVAKSTWLLLSSIVLFIRQRSSDFVLGRIRGAASVGAYTLASDLATMVTMELATPINRVSLSDLSARRTQEDLVDRFDLVTGVVAVILTPLGLGLAGCATVAVPVLFGPAWVSAGDVLRVLAVASLLAALVSNLGVPIISLGHYRYNALIHAIGAAALLPLLIAGVYFHGPVGAAVAVLIANAVTASTALFFAKRVMDYGHVRFARRVWRPLLAGTLMCVSMLVADHYLAASTISDHLVLRLVLLLALGAAAYPSVLFLLWMASGFPQGAERRTLELLQRLLLRLRPRAVAPD